MPSNILHLPVRRRADAPVTCPAQFYTFTGDREQALLSASFLQKAAAFQEIRDCLVAVDHNRLSAQQAEKRIQYFTRKYLGIVK